MIYNFLDFWQNFGVTSSLVKIDPESKVITLWKKPKLENEYQIFVSEKADLELYLFLEIEANLKISVHQKRNSRFKMVCFLESQNKSDFSIDWSLEGDESRGELYLFADLEKKAQLNLDLNFLEKSKKGQLKIIQKNLLRGEAKLTGSSNITIHQKAVDSQSELKIRNLVLSSKSTSQVAPNLKIFCQDSSSKHSVATNSLEPNPIYYLKTRGLSLDDIQKIHLKSFKEEITNQLPTICLS